jgi:hypothetical protein
MWAVRRGLADASAFNVRHVAPPWVPTQQTGAAGFKSFHLPKWIVQSGIARTPSILDNK